MNKKYYHVVTVNHIDLGFIKRKEEQAELLELWLERVLTLLERFPELKFAIEQAYHYRGLENRRPDLFAKVKKEIARGRIEMMGAMASSMETNFPNGESFVRNQLMGLRWTKEHLETEPKAAWLIDTFGTNAQVPQILKQFGFEYLFANRFGGIIPYDLFTAQGLDGSEITVIGRDLECTQIDPNSQAFVFCKGWNDVDRLFQDADGLKGELPCLVVHYLENEEVCSTHYLDLVAERNQRADEEWVHSSYSEYLEALKGRTEGVVKVFGDLNPEFTGTFALRTPIKIWNRRAESALLELEEWNALTGKHKIRQIEDYWWDLSYAQFHDVFSGSHEDRTYDDVIHMLQNVTHGCGEVLWSLFDEKEEGKSLLCLNGLPLQREEWIELPNPENRILHVHKGAEELSVRYSEAKAWCRPVLDPVSATELTLIYEESEANSGCEEWIECSTCTIENQLISMSFDQNSGISQLSLADGTVLMKDARKILTIRQDKGGFQIDDCMGEEKILIDEKVQISCKKGVKEQAVILSGKCDTMSWNHKKNRLSWSMIFTLTDNAPAVTVKVSIDWAGEAAKIRLLLPNTVDTAKGIYEIPFGLVKRGAYDGYPTAKGEWPAHRFAAVEDGEKGLALINTGVAGVEIIGSTLATTLLRAYPDEPGVWVPVSESTSQYGHHEYDFQIMPYQAGNRCKVITQAQKFNRPVRVSPCSKSLKGQQGSFLKISEPNIVLSAVKFAEDNSKDLILRYYEATGTKTHASIYIKNAARGFLSDVTEQEGKEVSCKDQTVEITCEPFEIQTLCLVRH